MKNKEFNKQLEEISTAAAERELEKYTDEQKIEYYEEEILLAHAKIIRAERRIKQIKKQKAP